MSDAGLEGGARRADVAEGEGLTLAEVAREVGAGASVEGDAAARVVGVQQDSRRVARGDLFVVRRGGAFDGAAYARDAVRRGAVAVLADRGASLPADLGVPVVRVEDARAALAYAAAAVYGHPAFALDIVGVTGTNGKTTTTHLVRAAVDGALGGAFCGVVGTVGHTFGGETVAAAHTTPEADELARVLAGMRQRGATHVAMEVSSIALVQARVAAVRFRVAAFTNFTQDHLDFHGSMDAYAAAKRILFTALAPGRAVINVDDAFGAELAAECRCRVVRVRVRPSPDGDVAPVAVEQTSGGTRLVARVEGRDVELRTRLLGQHNVENLLVTLGVVSALDLDVERAARRFAEEPGAPGRLERCDGEGDDVVVLVDYAHTPDALARAIEAVRGALPGRRLVTVFGCGGDRDPTKRGPMGRAAGERADLVVITSDNPRSEAPDAIAAAVAAGVGGSGLSELPPASLARASRGFAVEIDRRAAIELAILAARPGDVVLIAGKGHEDYQITGSVKRPFDDRLEARRALSRRRG